MSSTRQVLLHRVTQERSTLFYSIFSLPEDELVRRPLVGEWSAKDILGHVASWEAEMTRAIEQFMRGEHPAMLDIADCDAWNAQEARAKWDMSLAQVRDEMIAVRQHLLDVVAVLPGDAFTRPGPSQVDGPFVAAMLNGIAEHDREHWTPLMAHKVTWVASQNGQA